MDEDTSSTMKVWYEANGVVTIAGDTERGRR